MERPWWGEQGQGGQGLEKVFLWGREGGKEAPPTEALSFTAEKRRTKLICLWGRLTFVPSTGLCAKGGEDAKEIQGSVSDFLEIQSGWGRVVTTHSILTAQVRGTDGRGLGAQRKGASLVPHPSVMPWVKT